MVEVPVTVLAVYLAQSWITLRSNQYLFPHSSAVPSAWSVCDGFLSWNDLGIWTKFDSLCLNLNFYFNVNRFFNRTF